MSKANYKFQAYYIMIGWLFDSGILSEVHSDILQRKAVE